MKFILIYCVHLILSLLSHGCYSTTRNLKYQIWIPPYRLYYSDNDNWILYFLGMPLHRSHWLSGIDTFTSFFLLNQKRKFIFQPFTVTHILKKGLAKQNHNIIRILSKQTNKKKQTFYQKKKSHFSSNLILIKNTKQYEYSFYCSSSS